MCIQLGVRDLMMRRERMDEGGEEEHHHNVLVLVSVLGFKKEAFR